MNIMIPAWVDGTLQPVEKLEAHKLGLKHKAISVFVFHENKILLPLSLSYDHRVIDGAEGARFCAHLRESLGKDFAYKLAV